MENIKRLNMSSSTAQGLIQAGTGEFEVANLYADTKWAAFREQVIELDGGVCIECGRGRQHDVVLQVHHKQYISGRKPWQYDYSDCETLCRGCHAREHGEIRPDSGWEYVGEDDLGDLIGNCELCGTPIRYVHYVLHEHWEQMGVGTNCCDALTGTREATEARRRLGRLRRFLASSKWKSNGGRYAIKHRGFELVIVLEPAGCQLIVDNVQGKKRYKDVLHAKEFAFDFIDSGQAAEYTKRLKLRSPPLNAQAPPRGLPSRINRRINRGQTTIYRKYIEALPSLFTPAQLQISMH